MRLLAIALAALALAGCSDTGNADDQNPNGRTFVSVEVEGNQIPGGGPLTVVFDSGQISTFAGCNHGSGPVDLSNGKVVTELASTMMACPPPLGDADAWMSQFFEAQPSWSLSGDTLTLKTDTATVTLRDKKVVHPDRSLTDTTWQVTSLVSGQSVSTSQALEQAKPTVKIAADGAVTGSTGCNQITGHAVVSGTPAIIEFGPLATTRMACPNGLGEVEQAVMRVLNGKVQTAIDSDELTLTGADGYGLVLRAQ
ncbi:heat shock protein HslJ [Mycolicibacterium wolinskyi]|uniref:Heat shock protein HslJ n=1 Tax=Mycolicibacterium wolinskyi TaxID=59750 RepID=A0A132PIS5_9MYCO|nr:META domain-containing protein [Mycolicibacterium wolinskyi]KWX22203.1 heat shock protein HslJ [Mycolicibacterium wolinskyi]